MFKQFLIVSALTVCSMYVISGRGALAKDPIAWDGLGKDPNKPAVRLPKHRPPPSASAVTNAEREKVLSTLEPNSAAWWALKEEIDAESDRQMKKNLVICPHCLTK